MATDTSKISTNVLEMKFMRRTKQRLEEKEKRKQESNLQKAYLAGETEKPKGGSSSSNRFVFTKDLEFLEDLQYGRMSFKGCNPQVEKLMKYFTDKNNGTVKDSDDEKDVNDGEMDENMGGSRNRKGTFKRKSMEQSLIDESARDGKKRRVGSTVNCRQY